MYISSFKNQIKFSHPPYSKARSHSCITDGEKIVFKCSVDDVKNKFLLIHNFMNEGENYFDRIKWQC